MLDPGSWMLDVDDLIVNIQHRITSLLAVTIDQKPEASDQRQED
jgi:hypothetical protein